MGDSTSMAATLSVGFTPGTPLETPRPAIAEAIWVPTVAPALPHTWGARSGTPLTLQDTDLSKSTRSYMSTIVCSKPSAMTPTVTGARMTSTPCASSAPMAFRCHWLSLGGSGKTPPTITGDCPAGAGASPLATTGPPAVSTGSTASLPSTGAWRVGPTEWKEIPASDSCPPRSPAKVGEPDWTKNVPKAGYCASTSAPMDEALATARSKVASSVPAARFTA